MKKKWFVKLDLYGKIHAMLVDAASKQEAVIEARTQITDVLNNAHIIYVNEA